MRKFLLRPDGLVLNGKVTVLVASAATDRRQRWGQRLQEAFTIISEVAQRAALEQTMRDLAPGVLLLDLGLPGLGGVRSISRIQGLSTRTKIIALAQRVDDREGLVAFEEGAKGYDQRNIEPGQLRKAVEKVMAGEIWIQRRLVTTLLAALRSMKQSPRPPSFLDSPRLCRMTPREQQVAELITEGASNKEIAQQLNITERTVKAYLTELFRDLQVSDRLQLAVLLNREGLRPAALSATGSSRF